MNAAADEIPAGCGAFMFFVMVVLAIWCGGLMQDWDKDSHNWKVEAVSRGVAEWRVDVAGERSFHWLVPIVVKPVE